MVNELSEMKRLSSTLVVGLALLVTIPLVGKPAWVVTCAALPGEFNQWEDDLNAIVRSLRILK